VERLARLELAPADVASVDAATSEERPRERSRRLGEIFRKLEHESAIGLLTAAAKLALEHQASGLRLLLGFLEVKRPGTEVLGQLRGLSSLRRVSLKLLSGSWEEPEDSRDADPTHPILEVVAEGARLGALDLTVVEFPSDHATLAQLHRHLSTWFDRTARQLESGRELPDDTLHFITQLAMLEVSLLEKRVSHIASAIDPYDMRRIALLLPVLSRYDQDIEHMKDVVSRIHTYEPFLERSLTMEQVITTGELEKLIKLMSRDVAARDLARMVAVMRRRPILDREFAYQISQLYQIALLRQRSLGRIENPDPLSVMLEVLLSRQEDTSLTLSMEPDVAHAIWPVVEPWGARRPSRELIVTRVSEERARGFIAHDGTPQLPEHPREQAAPAMSLTELVRREIENDPFILGILDNPRAAATPGLLPFVARESRSPRVLDKIIRVPRLHSGETNRDVPRLLLMNPAHIPLSSLRRFIHVRFISKTDLRRLGRSSPDVRPEISMEVAAYLRTL
jgi:hypothetical protein